MNQKPSQCGHDPETFWVKITTLKTVDGWNQVLYQCIKCKMVTVKNMPPEVSANVPG